MTGIVGMHVEGPGTIRFQYATSEAPTALVATLHIRADEDAKIHKFDIVINSFTADRTTVTVTIRFTVTGTIVYGGIAGDASALLPGQCYTVLSLLANDAKSHQPLAKGYRHGLNTILLGEFQAEGTGSGGLHSEDIVANDTAGNAPVIQAMGVLGAIRITYGFAIYYHASGDVASRVITPALAQPYTTVLPTGFSIAANVWSAAALTLSQNEEGIYWAQSIQSTFNDNGSITEANPTTDPAPFPYRGSEEDVAAILTLTATDGNANDTLHAVVQFEEWVVIDA